MWRSIWQQVNKSLILFLLSCHLYIYTFIHFLPKNPLSNTRLLYVVCCMFYVVCCIFYVVCFMLYILCCMFYVLCCIFYAVCFMLYVLCFINSTVCDELNTFIIKPSELLSDWVKASVKLPFCSQYVDFLKKCCWN